MLLQTQRLRLRGWRDDDAAPLAAINADPDVAAWVGGALDRTASDALLRRFQSAFENDGFAPMAVERIADARLLGFAGLSRVAWQAHFTPAVEIAWRLERSAWGRGYATEAARALLAHAFDTLRLEEVVSFTVPGNARSRAVMERVGLRRDPAGDFDHPRLPEGHELRPHVLYRIKPPYASLARD